MVEHPFVPFRVEHAAAGFEINLFGERADLGVTLCGIDDVDGRGLALGARDGAADAAQRIDILVDSGDAKFDRVEVLIGEIDCGERGLQQVGLTDRRALHAISKAFFRFEHVRQFVGVGPVAAVDQLVDVGPVSTLGVRENAQRCCFQIAAVLGGVGQAVLANEVHVLWLVGLCCDQGSLGQHPGLQRQQIAENA